MSAFQMLEQSRTDVPSIVIPSGSVSLLLPNESIAEVVKATRPLERLDSQSWYLGEIYWRERQVPLLELNEFLEIDSIVDPSFYIILNFTGYSDDLTFVAIPASDAPSSIRITENEIEKLDVPELAKGSLMSVMAAGREFTIPNVRLLEEKIVDLGY